MSNPILNDGEIIEASKMTPEEYGAPPYWWLNCNRRVAKAEAKKLLEIELERGFLTEEGVKYAECCLLEMR